MNLQSALSTLGRLDREMFLAAFVDHMPDAEIARRTGLTVPQVERRIARAIVVVDDALRGQQTWRQRLGHWWPL